MNYGYAPLDPREEPLQLADDDEPHRYSVHLYHHVARAIDFEGLRVLEVGSGRGGGAEYVKRYLRPKAVVGVDCSESAVAFCRTRYRVDGLSFETADAESLPFANESFDALINIESSHCYGSFDVFLMQVNRVLRPGGFFLFADFRRAEEIDLLRDQLRRSGMTLIRERDITPNVLKALDLVSDRKAALIHSRIPRLFVRSFQEFAGVKGSRIHTRFQTRGSKYLSFVLQKPLEVGGTSDQVFEPIQRPSLHTVLFFFGALVLPAVLPLALAVMRCVA